jgi:alcohol dehydrogenase class IV
MSTMAEFRVATRMVMGAGCARECLAEELRALGTRVVALIVDLGVAQAGLLDDVLEPIIAPRLEVCGLVGVDPDVAEAERAAAAALECGAEAVLAIGGGSALCAGKAVAIRLTNAGSLDEYAGRDRLIRPPAPTIAIPTTAGSGSEVSTVVVLHDSRHRRHLVIRGRGYEPDVAVLDGTLLASLPPRPMIEAALDALSHCYEALWAHKASALTDALALHAARTIRTSLPHALGGSVDHMQALIVASAMANLACGNAELGLVHALTSAPGVRLPHGHQNGVLLPFVAEFNRSALRDEVAREVEELPAFYEQIGFEARFTDDVAAELMVAAALENPFLANNARSAGEAELRALLAAAGAR